LTTTFFTLNSIHFCKKSPFFTSVVIIANFCRISFKRIIPDEYYLFSSSGSPLRPRDQLLWQQTTDYVTNVLRFRAIRDSSWHLCRQKSFM